MSAFIECRQEYVWLVAVEGTRHCWLFIVMVIHEKLPGNETLTAVVTCTVALSIIAHGLSAVPLAKMYGKVVADRNGVI